MRSREILRPQPLAGADGPGQTGEKDADNTVLLPGGNQLTSRA